MKTEPIKVSSLTKKVYWHGDEAKYTGKKEFLYGVWFYELVLLEGHKKGQTVLTQRIPQGMEA